MDTVFLRYGSRQTDKLTAIIGLPGGSEVIQETVLPQTDRATRNIS